MEVIRYIVRFTCDLSAQSLELLTNFLTLEKYHNFQHEEHKLVTLQYIIDHPTFPSIEKEVILEKVFNYLEHNKKTSCSTGSYARLYESLAEKYLAIAIEKDLKSDSPILLIVRKSFFHYENFSQSPQKELYVSMHKKYLKHPLEESFASRLGRHLIQQDRKEYRGYVDAEIRLVDANIR